MTTNFEIKNFQGIHLIQENLPFNAPWIFLTGENGFGKTNILQALARVLGSPDDNRFYEAISPLEENSEIFIEFDSTKMSIPSKGGIRGKMEYRIMGYGAGRLDMGSESSTKFYGSASSLFESPVLLKNIEREGLSRWYFKSNEKDKFDDCVYKFKQLIPNLHDIIVDDDSMVWYIEKDQLGSPLPKVQFRELASGYKNVISMVGDIILRLNAPRKKYENLDIDTNMRAVVLIDELELYLHPKWQKELPGILSKLFPNTLFIASTHSPIPLLGAPKGSVIYTVNRTKEEGITMTRLDDKLYIDELLPNTLLTSPFFGMENIWSNNFNSKNQLRLENSYEELDLNKKLDKKIDDFMTSQKENDLIERIRQRKKQ